MRKIAAHYWLRPDGTIGKFPIITFNEFNKITEVRERKEFTEEAGLELVNGFLVPGFVDFAPTSLIVKDEGDLKKYLNRQIIGGTKVLGVNEDLVQKIREISVKGLEIVRTDSVEISSEYTAFDILRAQKGGIDQLVCYTCENARKLGVHINYGALEVGKAPGLLSIVKMDYENFNVTPDSRIRIVI